MHLSSRFIPTVERGAIDLAYVYRLESVSSKILLTNGIGMVKYRVRFLSFLLLKRLSLTYRMERRAVVHRWVIGTPDLRTCHEPRP